MNMKLHTWAVTAGAAVLTTAMLATGSIAASADTTTVSTGSTGQCRIGEHLVRGSLKLPADLRRDLKNLRAETPGPERRQQAKDIRDGALDGTYGSTVQSRAQHGKENRRDVIANLPAQLKTDLAGVRAADPAARPAMIRTIGQTALDGGYGDTVKATAERLKSSDFWKNCVAG